MLFPAGLEVIARDGAFPPWATFSCDIRVTSSWHFPGGGASDTLSRMPDALRSFLANPRRPPDTLTYHELHGFLFAVACAPELAKPSEWLPIVFGEQDAGYETLEEAREVLGQLMALYNSVNAAVAADRDVLWAECALRSDPIANLDVDAPVAQWSRGFLRGHQWLEESWNSCVPKEMDDEFAAMLMALSFFASRDLAEAFCAETQGNLEQLASTIQRVFPDAVAQYAHLGRSIQQVLSEEARDRAAQPSVKVGRNEPCPYGSGRKYKKCCGRSPQ